MVQQPFYDPTKTYEENFEKGPFGAFADGKKTKEQGSPIYTFLRQKLFLPFGIPAGPLLNGSFVKAALDKGFDIVTYKTVRSRSYPCHPFPNVLGIQVSDTLTLEQADQGVVGTTTYHEPLSITNSFGVPSQSPDFWQKDLQDAVSYAKEGQVVVGSFQGTLTGDTTSYLNDWIVTARLVKETGAKILEANLSCPNEGSGHLLCFDTQAVRTIIDAIKNEIGDTPLLIKIAYFKDQEALEELIKTIGSIVDGIAAINTIPAKIYNEHHEQALPGKGRLVSGTCGHAIQWAGINMVERLKSLREKNSLSYTIMGVGGVTKAEDYQTYREKGAEAVMSATGAMWNPFLAQEIKGKYI